MLALAGTMTSPRLSLLNEMKRCFERAALRRPAWWWCTGGLPHQFERDTAPSCPERAGGVDLLWRGGRCGALPERIDITVGRPMAQ